MAERHPENFSTWREESAYQEARAIHAERDAADLRVALAAKREEWIATLGSDGALRRVSELEKKLEQCWRDKSAIGNRLRGAEARASHAKALAIKEVVARLDIALRGIVELESEIQIGAGE